MKHFFFLVVALAFTVPAFAQQPDVEQYVREHQPAIIREFMDLVAIPNVRSDLANIKRNAELLRHMLERREMKPEVWDTPSTPPTITSTPTTRTCGSPTCGTGSRRWRRS